MLSKKVVKKHQNHPEQTRAQRVAAMQAKDRAAARKRKGVIGAIMATTFVVIGTSVAMIFVAAGNSNAEQVLPPSVEQEGGPFLVSAENTPESAPVLSLYEDFQCPACQQFEVALGPTVTEMAESGSANVQVQMMTFLDASLGNNSSSRALQAAAAADEQGRFLEYHSQVYAGQGAEGSGFTDEQLEQFAVAAGVPDVEQWRESYLSGKYEEYAEDSQRAAAEADVQSTPTILLDGENIRNEITTVQSFVDLVTNAGGGELESTPAPTETYDGETTQETPAP